MNKKVFIPWVATASLLLLLTIQTFCYSVKVLFANINYFADFDYSSIFSRWAYSVGVPGYSYAGYLFWYFAALMMFIGVLAVFAGVLVKCDGCLPEKISGAIPKNIANIVLIGGLAVTVLAQGLYYLIRFFANIKFSNWFDYHVHFSALSQVLDLLAWVLLLAYAAVMCFDKFNGKIKDIVKKLWFVPAVLLVIKPFFNFIYDIVIVIEFRLSFSSFMRVVFGGFYGASLALLCILGVGLWLYFKDSATSCIVENVECKDEHEVVLTHESEEKTDVTSNEKLSEEKVAFEQPLETENKPAEELLIKKATVETGEAQ